MNLAESIHSVWRVVGRNKVRSFLTMLGIIIGVMSVIVIMSVGAGAQSLILNQVKSMGSNLVGILPGKSDEKGPPASAIGILITSLKSDDIKALLKENPHLLAGTGYVRGTDTVNWGDQKIDTNFTGVNAQYVDVEDAGVAAGRFFTDDEERGAARLAVLGSRAA
ncbi:MAG: ABC transporter permease, partial [Patescibacteria group bacterium]